MCFLHSLVFLLLLTFPFLLNVWGKQSIPELSTPSPAHYRSPRHTTSRAPSVLRQTSQEVSTAALPALGFNRRLFAREKDPHSTRNEREGLPGWQSSIAQGKHSNRAVPERKLYMESYMRRALPDRGFLYNHYRVGDSRTIRPFVSTFVTKIPEYRRPPALILRIRSRANYTSRDSLIVN